MNTRQPALSRRNLRGPALLLLAAGVPAACAAVPTAPAVGALPPPPGTSTEPPAAGDPPGALDPRPPGTGPVADDAGAPAGQSAPEGDSEYPVHGSLATRGRARWTSGNQDFDLYMALDLEAGDPERDSVTMKFAGAGNADLGGEGDEFDGISETYQTALTGLVYDAYAEVHTVDALPMIRIGRQSDIETPEFLVYDGVRLETAERGDGDLQLGVYGGQSVHYYESSPDGDALYGAYVQARPWEGGRARLDWTHAKDEQDIGTVDDDLYGVSLWQTISRELRFQGAYTALTGDSRDVDLRGTWYEVESDLLVQAYYYELFETQKANPLEFDKFYETLFDYYPFRRYGALASKGITDRVRLEGGVDLRDVDDSGDEGPYNRDVQRYHLTTMIDRVFTEDTTVSLTGDLWETSGNHQETETFGADVTHEFSEKTRGSIGSFYYAYEVDPMSGKEREDVRTYYTGVRHELTDTLSLRARYEFEDAEEGDFQTVMVRLLWQF